MNDIYLQRLMALRDEAFPLARQAEAEGKLDFNVFISECGTYRCLLGWWVETPTAQRDGWRISYGEPCWGKPSRHDPAEVYFGISGEEWMRLFGMTFEGTLNDRLEFLNKLIAKRQRGET